MTNDPASKPSNVHVDRGVYRLEVSSYDRVASMLISLLVLLGLAVLIMFVVWLTNRIFIHHEPPPVLAAELGEPDDPWGGADDIEPPAPQDEIIEEEIEETLEAVTDAIATRATMMSRRVSGDGTGRGGRGTGRGRKGIPRNWEVQFAKGNTLNLYARQLDFFKIELGVRKPGNVIEYASNLSSRRPRKRVGPTDQEKRYYLTWRRGNLQQADRDLLDKAGIVPGRSPIFKFLTKEVEAQLYSLEQAKAGSRDKKISMTRFGLLPDGDGYKFYVMTQRYR